jgi:hypothetical protein
MKMPARLSAALLAASMLAGGCAAPSAEVVSEATHGRITKIVPVTIESDYAPAPGYLLKEKNANRPGQRITVLLKSDMIIEVTQDEDPTFRVGDMVRIEGNGVHRKILHP